MTFTNIFNTGASGSESAERTSREVHDSIPGATDTSHIVRQTSPEAVAVMGFISTLFRSAQDAAGTQREASRDPASTVGMAASARDTASQDMEARVGEEDLPEPPEQQDPRDRPRP